VKIDNTGISAPNLPNNGVWSRPPETQLGFNSLLASEMDTAAREPDSGPVLLGTITRDTPTVSQLLYKSPFKAECWNIIHDQVNSDKPFNRIQPGTQVHYDPETRELAWGRAAEVMLAKQSAGTPAGSADVMAQQAVTMVTEAPAPDDATEAARMLDLSQSAKQFIGRDYEQMDCYELLVGGLKELGVQYAGKGGLHEHLVNRASQQGLARNHYLNGEGLVSASGKDVFKETYYRITDPEGTVDEIMAELSPRLEQGQILSFSMRNRGHTGVISKMKDQWTFINSGKMDNNLSGENGGKAVGEESLEAELLNWFKLVNKEKEALQITLGRLDMDRLSMFSPPSIRQKV
jgi:hypothetical protein